MKIKTKSIFSIFILMLVALVSSATGFLVNQFYSNNSKLISPFVKQENIDLPLLKYSIVNLKNRKYQASNLKIEKIIEENDSFKSYLFSYITMNKKMTGQINIPNKITLSPLQKHSVIVMIRGYVPEEIYKTGMGTKNAAAKLAKNGYITIAPDFFGFGESDSQTDDTWQTRFEKPINIIELIKSLEKYGVAQNIENKKTIKVDNIGIWAHSNGGQIALTTLEIIDQAIPTTLWAPVTAPFPYSILYFGDELEDEGKAQRKWIAMFEKKYDVFDFSLTKHLDLLQGPIQIQHGDNDDAALIYWSEEFLDKIKQENSRREKIKQNNQASQSATKEQNLEPIEISLYKYKDTNHNMIPNWSKATNRDIQFFDKYLN